MHSELDTTAKARPVAILGINEVNQESGNVILNSENRTLPWLQDTPAANVWGAWAVTWRDVVVLDDSNRVITVYNLTTHDLADSANYATLKNLLLMAARAIPGTSAARIGVAGDARSSGATATRAEISCDAEPRATVDGARSARLHRTSRTGPGASRPIVTRL